MNPKLLLVLIFACAALMLTVHTEPASAQLKLQENPGGYHGELDFPISWKRYYSYQEWVDIMHKMQKQYPHLCDIESIGKSRMGRDQFLLTITAKAAGDHSTKAAMWVDGAVHGNEVNGITCSLYVAWYLLTRYDYDKYIYDMLNRTTFYILPGLNVDANDSFVAWPNNPNNPREPYRPEDNDGDGLYDEDQTEDVDGDGQLSNMYLEDPEGNLTLSEDGRRFVNIVNDVLNNGLRFRSLGAEGFDNDGDGRSGEDDIGGPDPNRNYPSGWNLSDGWPYTMSEPETRNAFNFMLAHPNIFAGYHYHNTGRLIMFCTPPRPLPGQTQPAAPAPQSDPYDLLQQTQQQGQRGQRGQRQQQQITTPPIQQQQQTPPAGQRGQQRGQRQQQVTTPPVQQQITTPPVQQQQQTPPAGQRGQRLGQQQPPVAAEETPPVITNKYAYTLNREVRAGYEEDKAALEKLISVGNRILRNYSPSPSASGSSGQAQCATYDMLGAYGILIELWGTPLYDIDLNDDNRASQEEMDAWFDIDLTGEGWTWPHKAQHPDYGEIWIGGTQKKHTQRTPPARYIETEAYKNAQFVLYNASQFPLVEIDDVKVTPCTANLSFIDVTLKNDKIYPTFSDRRRELGKAVQDKLTFSSSNNIAIVNMPELTSLAGAGAPAARGGRGGGGGGFGGQRGGGFNPKAEQLAWINQYFAGRQAGAVLTNPEHQLRLKGNDQQTFRYLVNITGPRGWVELNLTSELGGKAAKRVNINVNQ